MLQDSVGNANFVKQATVSLFVAHYDSQGTYKSLTCLTPSNEMPPSYTHPVSSIGAFSASNMISAIRTEQTVLSFESKMPRTLSCRQSKWFNLPSYKS
jgi:hypothetical protein